jgi:hypothetical protein
MNKRQPTFQQVNDYAKKHGFVEVHDLDDDVFCEGKTQQWVAVKLSNGDDGLHIYGKVGYMSKEDFEKYDDCEWESMTFKLS